MQRKRIVVTLDPDYVPWEHNEDVVKLRKKKIKVPKFLIGALALMAMLTLAVVNKVSQDRKLTEVIVTATPTAVVEVAEDPYENWCEYGGLLLRPGKHWIGDTERECKAGVLSP